jgi:hypothetical protein
MRACVWIGVRGTVLRRNVTFFEWNCERWRNDSLLIRGMVLCFWWHFFLLLWNWQFLFIRRIRFDSTVENIPSKNLNKVSHHRYFFYFPPKYWNSQLYIFPPFKFSINISSTIKSAKFALVVLGLGEERADDKTKTSGSLFIKQKVGVVWRKHK